MVELQPHPTNGCTLLGWQELVANVAMDRLAFRRGCAGTGLGLGESVDVASQAFHTSRGAPFGFLAGFPADLPLLRHRRQVGQVGFRLGQALRRFHRLGNGVFALGGKKDQLSGSLGGHLFNGVRGLAERRGMVKG